MCTKCPPRMKPTTALRQQILVTWLYNYDFKARSVCTTDSGRYEIHYLLSSSFQITDPTDSSKTTDVTLHNEGAFHLCSGDKIIVILSKSGSSAQSLGDIFGVTDSRTILVITKIWFPWCLHWLLNLIMDLFYICDNNGFQINLPNSSKLNTQVLERALFFILKQ